MRRWSLSLAGLMGLVAAAALLLGAAMNGTPLWTVGAFYGVTTSLLVATLFAIFLRGGERGFWAGFALFGWANFLIVQLAKPGDPLGQEMAQVYGAITRVVLPQEPMPQGLSWHVLAMGSYEEAMARLIQSEAAWRSRAEPGNAKTLAKVTEVRRATENNRVYYNRFHSWVSRTTSFKKVLPSMVTLVFALMGGVVGRLAIRQGERWRTDGVGGDRRAAMF